jgi:hypothetical protein
VKNRGIARARIYFGALLLAAAVVVWATAMLMSPHGGATAESSDQIRVTVATFIRNAALGTLLLTGLATYFLFPRRRPAWPRIYLGLIATIAVLTLTSLYQLLWLQTLG